MVDKGAALCGPKLKKGKDPALVGREGKLKCERPQFTVWGFSRPELKCLSKSPSPSSWVQFCCRVLKHPIKLISEIGLSLHVHLIISYDLLASQIKWSKETTGVYFKCSLFVSLRGFIQPIPSYNTAFLLLSLLTWCLRLISSCNRSFLLSRTQIIPCAYLPNIYGLSVKFTAGR